MSQLLHGKGSAVVTVRPDASVAEVVALLTERRIGAAVVSEDGVHIAGIVSERDVVRAVAAGGANALRAVASSIMTSDVVTCRPDDTIELLMSTMTERRVRHVPVEVDGQLAGIVSIGDVVKDRIQSLELESRALQDYISNPY